MKKLSEYKDEEALEMLAELIDPCAEVFSDEDFKKGATTNDFGLAAKAMCKNHPKATMKILATLDRVPVEEYHCNLLSLPMKVIEILNDPELLAFFTYQGQSEDEADSGSVTENTEEIEEA